jgi:hypothetical protein
MPRSTTRFTVEEVAKVDVRYLARHGMIDPGYRGTLSWWRGDRKTGSIGVGGHGTEIELVYQWRGEHVEQAIQLDGTECHLGGERVWFLCPWCGRRCAILYGPGKEFACRLCYRLNYDSQRNGGCHVAIRRMQCIRHKLGGGANVSEPFPARPKGMHRRTYGRIVTQYGGYQQAFGATVARTYGIR